MTKRSLTGAAAMHRSFRHSYDVQVQHRWRRRAAVQTKTDAPPAAFAARRCTNQAWRGAIDRAVGHSWPGRPIKASNTSRCCTCPSCVGLQQHGSSGRGLEEGCDDAGDDMWARTCPGRRDGGGDDMRTRTRVRRARIDGTAATTTTPGPVACVQAGEVTEEGSARGHRAGLSVLVPAGW